MKNDDASNYVQFCAYFLFRSGVNGCAAQTEKGKCEKIAVNVAAGAFGAYHLQRNPLKNLTILVCLYV